MYIKKEQQQVISDDIVDYLARLYKDRGIVVFLRWQTYREKKHTIQQNDYLSNEKSKNLFNVEVVFENGNKLGVHPIRLFWLSTR